MEFINARKLEDCDGVFDNFRRQKFLQILMLSVFMHSLGYVITVGFFVFPLIEFALGESIRFPQPLYVPFDFATHSWIWYALMYIFICFSTHHSGQMVIATCLYQNSLIEYLSNEFHILGLSFESALDASEEESFDGNYRGLIQRHQELLRLL